jgi:hypothetical protein
MERIATALETISDSLALWCKLEAQRFENQYPVKTDVRDATITRIPTREDAIKEAQGASDEPIEEWIGFREQQVIDKSK